MKESLLYSIRFLNLQGEYVLKETQPVDIQVLFSTSGLIASSGSTVGDYSYQVWWDSSYSGYTVNITFSTSGNFKPEYNFNKYTANSLIISNGPLFMNVQEARCAFAVELEKGPLLASPGSEVSMIFQCIDGDGQLIAGSYPSFEESGLFIDEITGTYTVGAVQILGSGKYKVSANIFTSGSYSLKVYSGLRLIYESKGFVFLVTRQSANCLNDESALPILGANPAFNKFLLKETCAT